MQQINQPTMLTELLASGCDPNEDNLRFAYRCMMQAHKMLKLAQPKRGIWDRR